MLHSQRQTFAQLEEYGQYRAAGVAARVDGNPALYNECLALLKKCKAANCVVALRTAAMRGKPCLSEEEAASLVDHMGGCTSPSQGMAILHMFPPVPHLYHRLMRSYAKNNNLRGVTMLASQAMRDGRLQKTPELSYYTLLNTIKSFGTAGRTDIVLSVFQEAWRSGAWDVHKQQLGNTLIDALESNAAQAWNAYELLVRAGFQPDLVSYNTLLKCCMRQRLPRLAEKVHVEMQAKGVVGDDTTYNTLVKVYAYSKDMDRLGQLQQYLMDNFAAFQAAEQPAAGASFVTATAGFSAQSLRTGSEAACDASRWAGCESANDGPAGAPGDAAIRHAARSAGSNADPARAGSRSHLSRGVWGSLLLAYGRARQPEAAWALWKQLRAAGLSPSVGVCNAIMIVCMRAQQGERALQVFDSMASLGVRKDVRSYQLAIQACGAAEGRLLPRDELQRAFAYLEAMRNNGFEPGVMTYTTVCNLCAQAHDGQKAWGLWQQLREQRMPVDAPLVTAVLKALGSAGMIDEAMLVFRAVVWGPRRSRPTRPMYLTLIKACRDAGALEQALALYSGMRAVGFAPANKQFQQLIAACAEEVLRRGPEAADRICPALSATFLRGKTELDLHGLSVREARAAVLSVIRAAMYEHQKALAEMEATPVPAVTARKRKGRRANTSAALGTAPGTGQGGKAGAPDEPPAFMPQLADLQIITGKGSRTAQGPCLRDEIMRLLQQELCIPVMLAFNRASPLAAGDEHDAAQMPASAVEAGDQDGSKGTLLAAPNRMAAFNSNPGRIVVTREALLQWLRTKGQHVEPLKCEWTAPVLEV